MKARFLIVVTLAGCLVAPDDHTLGSAPPGAGGGTGSFVRCVVLSTYGQVCATVGPVVCGGITCAADEVCCQTTGTCVAREFSACPNRPTNDPNHQPSCGSNADCASTESCVPDGTSSQPRCFAESGHCQPIANCAYCFPPGSDQCQVCGCNGVTYASDQEACVAGATALHRGACGVPSTFFDGGAFSIPCGTADQCPSGAQCCFRTGMCFDSSEPWRCELQPNGSILNCASHGDCNPNIGGGNGQNDTSLCQADACGGPGLCGWRPSSSSCGGDVHLVCGCDGVTYVNECFARSDGTRVASLGACP